MKLLVVSLVWIAVISVATVMVKGEEEGMEQLSRKLPVSLLPLEGVKEGTEPAQTSCPQPATQPLFNVSAYTGLW